MRHFTKRKDEINIYVCLMPNKKGTNSTDIFMNHMPLGEFDT